MTTYIISDRFRESRRVFSSVVGTEIANGRALRRDIVKKADCYRADFDDGDSIVAIPLCLFYPIRG